MPTTHKTIPFPDLDIRSILPWCNTSDVSLSSTTPGKSLPPQSSAAAKKEVKSQPGTCKHRVSRSLPLPGSGSMRGLEVQSPDPGVSPSGEFHYYAQAKSLPNQLTKALRAGAGREAVGSCYWCLFLELEDVKMSGWAFEPCQVTYKQSCVVQTSNSFHRSSTPYRVMQLKPEGPEAKAHRLGYVGVKR